MEIIKNIHERYSFIHYNFSTNRNHFRNFVRIESIFGSCKENSILFIRNVSIYCHAHFTCKMVLLIGWHAVIAVDWTTKIYSFRFEYLSFIEFQIEWMVCDVKSVGWIESNSNARLLKCTPISIQCSNHHLRVKNVLFSIKLCQTGALT